jgi:AbrB family looped-hinge helix DNA binding protein
MKDGILYAMKTTIDAAGRLVLPKAAREALHLQGEAELEVRITEDHVELEPVPLEVDISEKDGFYIAIPRKSPERSLSADEVEEARLRIRDERESSQR